MTPLTVGQVGTVDRIFVQVKSYQRKSLHELVLRSSLPNEVCHYCRRYERVSYPSPDGCTNFDASDCLLENNVLQLVVLLEY